MAEAEVLAANHARGGTITHMLTGIFQPPYEIRLTPQLNANPPHQPLTGSVSRVIGRRTSPWKMRRVDRLDEVPTAIQPAFRDPI